MEQHVTKFFTDSGVIFFDDGTEKSLGLKNFMKAKDVFAKYIQGDIPV